MKDWRDSMRSTLGDGDRASSALPMDYSMQDLRAPNIFGKGDHFNEPERDSLWLSEKRRTVASDALAEVMRPEVKFKTGSRYQGHWNVFGMAGTGTYKMFHGVDYEGKMVDGMFDGSGMIWYPNCCRVEGWWKKGRLLSKRYYYNDDLIFKEKDWDYCQGKDRRFFVEKKYGIKPTGRTMMSSNIPPRKIPPGCYDTGDGFYNPITKCVVDAENGEILRIPKKSEEQWIMDNYPRSPGVPSNNLTKVGATLYAPDKKYEQKKTKEGQDVGKAKPKRSDSLKLEEEEEEDDDSAKRRVTDKCTGRYDLVVKMAPNDQAYKYKFILVDERKDRCPKESRLMLPLLGKEGLQRISIVPEVSVSSPEGCVHESKHVVANKLLLLVRLFQASERAGGPHRLEKSVLKGFEAEFAKILEQEGVEESSSESLPSLEMEPYDPIVRKEEFDEEEVEEVSVKEVVVVEKPPEPEPVSEPSTEEGELVEDFIDVFEEAPEAMHEKVKPSAYKTTITDQLEMMAAQHSKPSKHHDQMSEVDRFRNDLDRRRRKTETARTGLTAMTEQEHLQEIDEKMEDVSRLQHLISNLPPALETKVNKLPVFEADSVSIADESVYTRSASDLDVDLLNEEKTEEADEEWTGESSASEAGTESIAVSSHVTTTEGETDSDVP